MAYADHIPRRMCRTRAALNRRAFESFLAEFPDIAPYIVTSDEWMLWVETGVEIGRLIKSEELLKLDRYALANQLLQRRLLSFDGSNYNISGPPEDGILATLTPAQLTLYLAFVLRNFANE